MKHIVYAFTLNIVCLISAKNTVCDTPVLEPFTYKQDFETQELSAWASYPLWQDTAYDPNFRVDKLVPRDPNISIVQKVTPYTNVDNYAGAQKELDMYMGPGSTISFRYYLKTHLPAAFFKVILAAGEDGKVDFTIFDPPTNRWEWITVSFTDFIRENSCLAGRDAIKVNAVAVLVKFPNADPAMPVYLGLDDVVFNGKRAMAFQFAEPEVVKLSEWKPYIPVKHYHRGDNFILRGNWPLDAQRVTLDMCLLTSPAKNIYSTTLSKVGDVWTLKEMKLNFEEGLYLCTLTALIGGKKLSETEFTVYIAPGNIGGKHPRLWFDSEKKKWVESRLKSERFKRVYENMLSSAKSSRERVPLDEVVFDIDQFPDEDWLPTLQAWSGNRIGAWRNALYNNALAYAFHEDREAGEYAKNLFVSISRFPYWLHPWMIKRGQHIYYPLGEMGMDLALGYDLLYDLMDENERIITRKAMMNQIVLGCHKGYVEDDLVTSNTSNWVAHITGGSLMCQAAMYGDGPDVEQMEPYFTGAIFKDYELIQKVLDSDGAYGEGYGYYNFSMLSWSKSLPAVENVFKVDMSGKLDGSYKEIIWAGIVKDKQDFYFGDSGGNLGPLTNWAWLLAKYKDPLLGWFYNFLKGGETFMDVLYEIGEVPRDDPFDENPVKLFREVGTTVFKSGWEKDDFVFVMRTGPFFNHQHLDQGTFWLAGGGNIFIEERNGSTYYDDPLYQSWYTQPVAHSTLLIDRNHQSQRTGDLLRHVSGFNDYAFVTHFLDGEKAAFSSGDIGRLYWNKVRSIKRNVLYLKPNILLMVDTIVPAERDVNVTLLYQTAYLNDINAGEELSTITRESDVVLTEDPEKFRGEVTHFQKTAGNRNTLYIRHLYPEHLEVTSVETPHYLYTLQNQKPLEKEGMLTVTARTSGVPLVMAHILTPSSGPEPHITVFYGDGCTYGEVNGTSFTVNTRPGNLYEVKDFVMTDALVATGDTTRIFAAMCTKLFRQDRIILETDQPMTCDISSDGMKYYHCGEGNVEFGVPSKPHGIAINGEKVTSFTYNNEHRSVIITLPAGEGTVSFAYE
ncbi:MAG TPA: heparinase II/III family protein [Anaerolineae bacterium]|nr:heparinase II/III family protein [Anaerolineae bacterium]